MKISKPQKVDVKTSKNKFNLIGICFFKPTTIKPTPVHKPQPPIKLEYASDPGGHIK